MSRRIQHFALLLLGFALIVPASASATLMARISLETLVDEAEYIALVRAEEGIGTMEAGRIVTDTVLRVVDGWKGQGEVLTARTLGGEVGDYGSRVSGAASFEAGRLYVVFLERRAGHLRAMGMSQGVMPVFDGSVFTGGRGISYVSEQPNGAVEPGGAEQVATFLSGTMPLEALRTRVAELLAEQ